MKWKQQSRKVVAWFLAMVLCLSPVFSSGDVVTAQADKNLDVDLSDTTLWAYAGQMTPKAKEEVSSPEPVKTPEPTKKRIVVKAASDFTLKLPANWKNNYVFKSSKNKNQWAFYAKKCYNQTKEGWLFSIERYKDDSYTDMPSYELVGKWNGYYYVALFPTDIQTWGATEDAKKQYQKINVGSAMAAASIQPVKKVREGAYRVSEFSLKLPSSWKNKYIVKKKGKKDFYVAFYAKKCHKQTKAGWLFSIERYKDDSYTDMPCYELVGKWNGFNYVAVFPTDVQFEGATKTAMKQYQKLSKSVEKVARSIQP